MQKISFKPNQNILFNYGFHYSKTSKFDRYDRLIRTKNGLPRSAEWYYGPQIWMMNNFSLNMLKSTKIYDNAEFRFAHQFFEESRIDRDFNKDLRYRKTEKVNAYSLNLDFEKFLKSKGKLYYGLEYIQNVVNSDANVYNIISENQNPTASRYPEADWYSIAAYFNYAVKLSEKLNFQIGSRYNHFILNADFSNNKDYFPLPELKTNFDDGAVTGNAGFVYNLNNKTAFSMNISTAFRSPNVDDIGKVFDSEPGAVVVPNNRLKAEYAYNAEIGIARIISNNLKIDASAYYTYLNNALVRRDFVLNGKDSIIYDGELSKVQAIQNAALAYVYGLQFGLELKFPYGFSFSSKLNYQKGIEEMDDGSQSPSRHAAPLFGISKLKYEFKNISLHLYSVYNGEVSYENMNIGEISKDYLYAKDKNGNPYSPAWHTLNIKASYKINSSFAVNIGLENITDQAYRPYSSGIAASGRNFIISLNGRF
jgi:hemoglobin/transferrin/lactoferrin receptor protein